jgi:hypothetical protein
MDLPTETPATALAEGSSGSKVNGLDVLWILMSAFLVIMLANGALIYFATDLESDFRGLIDALC